MPHAAIKSYFLDSEDWSPLGIQIPSRHELVVVAAAADMTVTIGIDVEVVTPDSEVKVE